MPAPTIPGSVFISHSSKDATVAHAINRELTSRNIKCWIAPDHIPLGRDYANQIMLGIADCHVLMILISSSSIASDRVADEIEQANRTKRHLMPILIENVKDHLGKMALVVNRLQILSAYQGNIESHLNTIAEGVAGLLNIPHTPPAPFRQKLWRKRRLIAAALVLVLLACCWPAFNSYLHRYPSTDRDVQLGMWDVTKDQDMDNMSARYDVVHIAGDDTPTEMRLKPHAPDGLHQYLLFIENDEVKITEWKEGGEDSMTSISGAWKWFCKGKCETLLLLAARDALSDGDRAKLIEQINKLGKPPTLDTDELVVWFENRWTLFKNGMPDSHPDFDSTWANRLVSLLHAENIEFDGRTFPLF